MEKKESDDEIKQKFDRFNLHYEEIRKVERQVDNFVFAYSTVFCSGLFKSVKPKASEVEVNDDIKSIYAILNKYTQAKFGRLMFEMEINCKAQVVEIDEECQNPPKLI